MSLVDFLIVVVILAVICIYHGVKAKSKSLIVLTVVFMALLVFALIIFKGSAEIVDWLVKLFF